MKGCLNLQHFKISGAGNFYELEDPHGRLKHGSSRFDSLLPDHNFPHERAAFFYILDFCGAT